MAGTSPAMTRKNKWFNMTGTRYSPIRTAAFDANARQAALLYTRQLPAVSAMADRDLFWIDHGLVSAHHRRDIHRDFSSLRPPSLAGLGGAGTVDNCQSPN